MKKDFTFLNDFGVLLEDGGNYIDMQIEGYDLRDLFIALYHYEMQHEKDTTVALRLQALYNDFVNPMRMRYALKARMPKNRIAIANSKPDTPEGEE